MTWHLVLELDDQPPEHVASYRSEKAAKAAARELARLHQYTGGRVLVTDAGDSADQFQRYGRDRFHRQEPERVAVGQDLTVHVPPILLGREVVDAWRNRRR